MNISSTPVRTIATAAIALVGAWLAWQWLFCRFYVPPDHMAIITAKEGNPLPPGQILAKPGQKGVIEEPLGEGRHFRNPVVSEWRIEPLVKIPVGKAGLVTSKVGDDLPPGEFLADPGQKGIWRNVLGPGKYRLNTFGYDIEIIDAISIPIGYVGVMTSLSGTQAPDGQFAGPGQKGIRSDILQPGLYYINPKAYKIDVIEIGLNQVSLTGSEGGQVLTKAGAAIQNAAIDELNRNVLDEQMRKRKEYMESQGPSSALQMAAPQKDKRLAPPDFSRSKAPVAAAKKPSAPQPGQQVPQPQQGPGPGSTATLTLAQVVEFPSKDGFEISLDMTVEFELLPRQIAQVFRSYGDLPAVVDKILMPQILSISRLKGSSYGAKDFIVGEGREKFQNDLKDSLAAILKEKFIVVHNALIRHVTVPEQILTPIQEAATAIEQNLTNVARQNTAKKQADLNREEATVEQKRQEVEQETLKLQAEIKAEQEREVATLIAEAERQVADVAKQTAGVRADVTRKLGQADAEATRLVQGEEARGLQLKAAALKSPSAYTLLEFAEKLNPDVAVSILHTGPGTLWTDLEKATAAQLGGAKILSAPKSPSAPAR